MVNYDIKLYLVSENNRKYCVRIIWKHKNEFLNTKNNELHVRGKKTKRCQVEVDLNHGNKKKTNN